jgi:hypothetical protein
LNIFNIINVVLDLKLIYILLIIENATGMPHLKIMGLTFALFGSVRLVSRSDHCTAWERTANIFPSSSPEVPCIYKVCRLFVVDQIVDIFYKRGIKNGCLQMGLTAF